MLDFFLALMLAPLGFVVAVICLIIGCTFAALIVAFIIGVIEKLGDVKL